MSLQISIVPQPQPTTQPEPQLPPLWMYLDDTQIRDSSWGGGIRPCAPCPAVWVLLDDPHASLGAQWQFYLRAINQNMALEDVFLLLDHQLAFANKTGFRNLADLRADWFHLRDLDRKPPQLDKVRTCSRSVLTGTPGYSLAVAIKQSVTAVTDRVRGVTSLLAQRSFRSLLTAQNVLQVYLFDSRQPPPLKPGRAYPSRIQDVRLDDYLFNPRMHRWMFLVATIVNRAGDVVQFPRGGLYPWTGDGMPYSFLPHIANLDYGPVRVPLSRLQPVDRIPSPYRSN